MTPGPVACSADVRRLFVAVLVKVPIIAEVQVLFVEVVLVDVHISGRVGLVRVGVAGVLGFGGQRGHLGVTLLGLAQQLLQVGGVDRNLVSHKLKGGGQ